jgi:hypothetical protein
MTMKASRALWILGGSLIFTLVACGQEDVGISADQDEGDALGAASSGASCSPAGPALQAACVTSASGWGKGLNTKFGRLDGTLTAIAKPSSQCNQSNRTHFVLEVTMNGAPYALVVNVDDTQSSSGVFFGEIDAPLIGAPWEEGWHTDSAEKLDYVKALNVHSSAFQAYNETNLVNKIVCELHEGDDVSVYALGFGSTGAHDIHRNTGGGGADGAIVLHANSATPHYLMFHFVNQSF